ncbi:MAG TPA: hypothetical protein VN887_19915 [Candidatus Angelobacter sp.]|nr:hypothetical protein [Candidatus Angelobacter sp.]
MNSQPKVHVVGIYKLNVDPALVKEALDLKYPIDSYSAQARRRAEPVVFKELSSAVLIELTIENADENYSVGDFEQPDSDQAAYEERYLSADGTSIISEYVRPAGNFLRMVFFLHFFDPVKPLKTSYGVVKLPRTTGMPEWLGKVIRYEPVT